MDLIETTPLNTADLPITEFRDYLQLGSGFADDGAQDSLLELCLRAAMGAIEARTSRILIERTFEWKFARYRIENEGALLPLSPVTLLHKFFIYDRLGIATSYSRNDFQLLTDPQRPRLVPKFGTLPKIHNNGWGLMRIVAGYSEWQTVPPALRQAMFMLATRYYENRGAMLNGGEQMPLAIATLLAPFQRIRLGAGA